MNREHSKSPVAGVIQRLSEAQKGSEASVLSRLAADQGQTPEEFLTEASDPHAWLDRYAEEDPSVLEGSDEEEEDDDEDEEEYDDEDMDEASLDESIHPVVLELLEDMDEAEAAALAVFEKAYESEYGVSFFEDEELDEGRLRNALDAVRGLAGKVKAAVKGRLSRKEGPMTQKQAEKKAKRTARRMRVKQRFSRKQGPMTPDQAYKQHRKDTRKSPKEGPQRESFLDESLYPVARRLFRGMDEAEATALMALENAYELEYGVGLFEDEELDEGKLRDALDAARKLAGKVKAAVKGRFGRKEGPMTQKQAGRKAKRDALKMRVKQRFSRKQGPMTPDQAYKQHRKDTRKSQKEGPQRESHISEAAVDYLRRHAKTRLQYFPADMVEALNLPLRARQLHESQLGESALWSRADLQAIRDGIPAVLESMVTAGVDPRVIFNEVNATLGPLARMVTVMEDRSGYGPDEDLIENVETALDTLIQL